MGLYLAGLIIMGWALRGDRHRGRGSIYVGHIKGVQTILDLSYGGKINPS